MRVAHGALRMTTVFPRVRSANRPRMTGPAAQTNRMPAAAPSWRQCCEIMRPMEPSCRVMPSPSSRVARSARPAGFARQEPFTRRHHSDRESVSSILCLEQLARGETQSENSGAMKLARQHRQISLNNSGRLWCSLRQMHFPQIFSFVGKGADDDAKPINCLYTLDPKARPWADNVLLVPIDRIESNLLVGRRTKSLVLRHHETLERALGYLSGVEDVTNTCDDAEIYKCSDGIFTLTLRTTDRKWPSPMIFYVAETYDNDTQRFEVAVSSDGQRRPTDLLGID